MSKNRRFSDQFRSTLSEKLMELGNLILLALAISQIVGTQAFSATVFIAGVIFMLMCYIVSYIISP